MPPQDPDAARWFAEHLQVHEQLLRGWLQTRFPAVTDFDDVIQEAYVRVLAARAKREIRHPKSFFFATARNLAYDYYHKFHARSTEPLHETDDYPLLDESVDITETIARNQELELMTAAIQSLPERCRQVLTLRNVYGLSYREIAQHLGISERTVEVHLAAGIKRCAQFMAQYLDP